MTEEQARLLQVYDWLYCPKANECFQMGNGDITSTVIEKKYLYIPKYRDFFDNSTIPLTDEILVKNGFSINVFENCMYYDFPKNAGFDELIKAHYHLIKYNSDDYYFFEDCPFIKIRTVDEFQRLLRLMGFTDFANNFKV